MLIYSAVTVIKFSSTSLNFDVYRLRTFRLWDLSLPADWPTLIRSNLWVTHQEDTTNAHVCTDTKELFTLCAFCCWMLCYFNLTFYSVNIQKHFTLHFKWRMFFHIAEYQLISLRTLESDVKNIISFSRNKRIAHYYTTMHNYVNIVISVEKKDIVKDK